MIVVPAGVDRVRVEASLVMPGEGVTFEAATGEVKVGR